MRERFVVVGTDGSAGSRVADQWAALEAHLRALSPLLVYVDTPPVVGGPYGAAAFPTLTAFHDRAHDLVDQEAQWLRDQTPGVWVVSKGLSGGAAHGLIGLSGNYEMLVVGSWALPIRVPIARLGRALRRSPCVLPRRHLQSEPTGRRPGRGRRRWLTCIRPRRPFGFAAASARATSLRAVLVYGNDGYGIWEAPPELLDRLEVEASDRLRESLAKWREFFPEVQVEETVEFGHPVATLLSEATRARLLVVGSRGHGGFAGLLLGSVGQALIHDAACSAAIVR